MKRHSLGKVSLGQAYINRLFSPVATLFAANDIDRPALLTLMRRTMRMCRRGAALDVHRSRVLRSLSLSFLTNEMLAPHEMMPVAFETARLISAGKLHTGEDAAALAHVFERLSADATLFTHDRAALLGKLIRTPRSVLPLTVSEAESAAETGFALLENPSLAIEQKRDIVGASLVPDAFAPTMISHHRRAELIDQGIPLLNDRRFSIAQRYDSAAELFQGAFGEDLRTAAPDFVLSPATASRFVDGIIRLIAHDATPSERAYVAAINILDLAAESHLSLSSSQLSDCTTAALRGADERTTKMIAALAYRASATLLTPSTAGLIRS